MMFVCARHCFWVYLLWNKPSLDKLFYYQHNVLRQESTNSTLHTTYFGINMMGPLVTGCALVTLVTYYIMHTQ